MIVTGPPGGIEPYRKSYSVQIKSYQKVYHCIHKVLSYKSLSCIVFLYVLCCHTVFTEVNNVLTSLNLILINILERYCRSKIL